jgi:uncharacterized membrane protein
MTTPTQPPGRSSTGLDENLAAALSYLLGFITGIVFLVIEKDSRFVRFHAMQSTITFLLVFVVQLALASIPFLGWLLSGPFIVAVAILWLVLMFKALQRQAFKLPYIGAWAEQQIQ